MPVMDRLLECKGQVLQQKLLTMVGTRDRLIGPGIKIISNKEFMEIRMVVECN